MAVTKQYASLMFLTDVERAMKKSSAVLVRPEIAVLRISLA
jgi:hypothetical protein